MLINVKNIYHRILPLPLRLRISAIKGWLKEFSKKKKFLDKITTDNECIQKYPLEVDYLKRQAYGPFGIILFPYAFSKKYISHGYIVQYDQSYGLPYVIHYGKRLFFPKGWDEGTISNLYGGLRMEQDESSPHYYWNQENIPTAYDVLLDVGAAEGMISLNYIDKVRKVILVECDEQWREPLRATFMPWKDKVTFIEKYCSDSDSKNTITIDNILAEEKVNVVVKMDIEGAEMLALHGMKRTLSKPGNKFAICTYHSHLAAADIENEIVKYKCSYEFSKGVMVFADNCNRSIYCFRKGVIRGKVI